MIIIFYFFATYVRVCVPVLLLLLLPFYVSLCLMFGLIMSRALPLYTDNGLVCVSPRWWRARHRRLL